ncbi:MAG: hypothetical protein AAF586_09590 [Planctomycetota bacterium]
MHLPPPIAKACQPLFDYLPLDEAMPTIVGERPDENAVGLCEQALADPAMARPSLVAGLWLYVDRLEKSHDVSQGIQNPTGSFWHGIMHRREGDFANSHYWFRRVGTHPVFSRIEVAGGSAGSGTDTAGYDPHAFIDAVERAHEHDDATTPNPDGELHPELLSAQRKEWMELFMHCAEQRR